MNGFAITTEQGLSFDTPRRSPVTKTCGTNRLAKIWSTADMPLPSRRCASTIIMFGANRAAACTDADLCCLDCANLMTHHFKHVAEQHADQGIVFDDQDAKSSGFSTSANFGETQYGSLIAVLAAGVRWIAATKVRAGCILCSKIC